MFILPKFLRRWFDLRAENQRLRAEIARKTAWGERYRDMHDERAKELSATRVEVMKLYRVRDAADVLVAEWGRDDGTDPNGFVRQAERHLFDVVTALRDGEVTR